MLTKIRSSFTIQVYCFAASIALICLLLMGLTWIQGPRIRSTTLNTTLVTTAANQQLLLHMNQPPGNISKGQVQIMPEAPFAVTSSGNTVAIQFMQPLQNNTEYKVQLRTSDKRHSIKHRFHTGPATFYYAVNSQYKTEIRKHVMGAEVDQTIYSGSKIDDYTVIGNTLVLVVKESSKNTVLLYDMPSKQSQHITLPGNGTVTQLRGVPNKRLFGFMYTDHSNSADSNILLYDMNTKLLKAAGFSLDHSLRAIEWQLARNATTLLIRTPDSSTFLLNPGVVPIPLGQYSQLFGFSHDDGTILLRNTANRFVSLDIKERRQRSLVQQTNIYINTAFPLFTKRGYFMHIQTSRGGAWVQQVMTIQKGGEKTHYTNSSADKYIDSVSLSSNDQLLAVEERTTGSDIHKTRIINSNDNHVLKIIEGNMVRWPNGL